MTMSMRYLVHKLTPPRRGGLLCAMALAATAALPSHAVAVTPGAAFTISAAAQPTNLPLTSGGSTPSAQYIVLLSNTGAVASSSPIALTVMLPAGVTLGNQRARGGGWSCPTAVGESVVSCSYEASVLPQGVTSTLKIALAVATPGSLTAQFAVSGGGAPPVTASVSTEAGGDVPSFRFLTFSNQLSDPSGAPDTQAGDHPQALTTAIDFPEGKAALTVRSISIGLPPGIVGYPLATPRCTILGVLSASCPSASRVGIAQINFAQDFYELSTVAIYNVVPEHGHAAEFAIFVPNLRQAVFLYANVGPAPDYRIHVDAPDITRLAGVISVLATFFGDPTAQDGGTTSQTPFLTNPSDCSHGPLLTDISASTWEEAGQSSVTVYSQFASPPVTGCEALQFAPSVGFQPDAALADASVGLGVDLKVPQAQEVVGGLATPPLRKVDVALPEGMTINPAAANGLAVCSSAQIALNSTAEPSCPAASKVGTVEVDTPLVDHPLPGSVYVAAQGDNPFGSLIALYVVVDDPQTGVVVKIPGDVALDPQSGRVTATFDGLPQVPVSDIKLSFFGGPRGALVNPDACGSYAATSLLTPWSSPAPVELSSGFEVDEGCHGAQFSPSFVAGTVDNQAGAFSPFSASVSRGDGDQGLGGVSITTPPGLLGRLKGVERCGEPQASQGTCGLGSLIGHVAGAAGVGPDPVWVQGGQVFLTGPYKGAPFGLSIVVPAVAGPFNLGNVVVRAAIAVDPRTAQITVVSDPLPSILQGVPLRIQKVRVSIDREGFMFNPTSCEPLAVGGTLTSAQGATLGVSSRFQAANCATLGFHPVFSVSTQAKTSKKSGASLTVKTTYPAGAQANIRSVAVVLPKQLPSRLTTIQQACTEATFAANPASCPAGSVIGMGTVLTPILANPLAGPAYLVSHGGAAFPDLVIVLQGEGITLDLVGGIHIKHGITSSTFASLPDAPISSFQLTLPEGPHSGLTSILPANAKGSMCAQRLTMPFTITGQNGAVLKQNLPIRITGCPKTKTKAKAKAKAKHRAGRRRKG